MSTFSRFLRRCLLVAGTSFAAIVLAADPGAAGSSGSQNDSAPAAARAVTTDPSYKLSTGDTIAIAVQGESDMATIQTISHSGDVRVVYINNDVQLSGKTVRDAERYLEDLYREKKVLIHPVVNLTITSYSPREVTVVGAVKSPGSVAFPRDLTSMDLVDVINRAGGFSPIARKDAVVVTHRGADNKETTQTVDVESVMSGRRRQGPDRADVLIYPGDRIFVPERFL